MHRSGTSWIGSVLGSGGGFILKDEEIFNPSRLQRSCPISNSYEHICQDNQEHYAQYVDDILANKDGYSLTYGLWRYRSIKDFGRTYKAKLRSFNRRLLLRNRPLIMIEPLGLLSAEWICHRYGASVVVLIRHPAAIAYSLKRLGWGFNYSNLLRQELLTRTLLPGIQRHLSENPPPDDIVGQSALLWRLMYGVVLNYQANHPEWVFVRHEDLAREPMDGFAAMYEKLGLDFTNKARDFIRAHSMETNPQASPIGRRDDTKRDSLATTTNWKGQLTSGEIQRIRLQVQDISHHWYDDSDW